MQDYHLRKEPYVTGFTSPPVYPSDRLTLKISH